MLLIIQILAFVAIGSSLESPMVHLIVVVFSLLQSWTVLQSVLPFVTLTLEDDSQLFYMASLWMSLIFLCDYIQVIHFWQQYHRSDAEFNILLDVTWFQFYPITNDIHARYLIQVVFAKQLRRSCFFSKNSSFNSPVIQPSSAVLI